MIAGAAIVGGTAYAAGKRGQQAAQREDDQDARIDELEAEGAPAPAAVAAGPDTDELEKLAELHKEGVLTDDEFAAEKKKILGL